MHLLFHIFNYPNIHFPGGDFMKDPTFILTEQHPPKDPMLTSTLIQQTIIAWLTKELTK